MESQPSDMIVHEPRPICGPPAGTVAVIALLLATLATAVAIAGHYRAEVTSLRRELRSRPVPRPRGIVPLALSATTTSLPSSGTLHGQVTVISAWRSGEQAQVQADAHITGARPGARYALIGFDCTGRTGYQTWATGVTGAHGSASLSGPPQDVSLSDQYWLYVRHEAHCYIARRAGREWRRCLWI